MFSLLSRPPLIRGWASRCLALWESDRDLLQALELAKTFLEPTEALNSLWSCPSTFLTCSILASYFSEGYMSRSVPLERKRATRSAFSSLRKCWHPSSNASHNTRFCTTPHGYQRGGIFPVIAATVVLIFFFCILSPCLTFCSHLCLLLCCRDIFAVLLLCVTLLVKGISATC